MKAENRIFRSKSLDRITLSDQERRALVRHDNKLGGKIKQVMSIVSYSTFRRWARKMEDGSPAVELKATKPGAGRPRVQADIRATVVRIRNETGWGYTKILQATRRLGHRISRQAIKNVLVEAGLAPEPNDDPDNWSAFLRRHAETLWQCDFASEKKRTVFGMVDVYFLVFIHIGTRRIWVSPCIEHPTYTWTTQQARNFQIHLQDEELPCEILMRDNDQKYPDSFDEVFPVNTLPDRAKHACLAKPTGSRRTGRSDAEA